MTRDSIVIADEDIPLANRESSNSSAFGLGQSLSAVVVLFARSWYFVPLSLSIRTKVGIT